MRQTHPTLATLAFAAALIFLPGCPDEAGAGDAGTDAPGIDAPTDCPAGFLGDPSKDPMIELRALKADGTDVPLGDGADLAIIFPPQGGRVVFVGVRATNIDGCAVQITGALRDLATKKIMTDGRTLNLEREPDGGWGTSGHGTTANIEDSAQIGNYSNIPVCPNEWASVDIFDHSFELEVVVQDRRQRKVSKIIEVTPRCAEAGEKLTSCRCLCKNGYVLGESCGADAGKGDGAP